MRSVRRKLGRFCVVILCKYDIYVIIGKLSVYWLIWFEFCMRFFSVDILKETDFMVVWKHLTDEQCTQCVKLTTKQCSYSVKCRGKKIYKRIIVKRINVEKNMTFMTKCHQNVIEMSSKRLWNVTEMSPIDGVTKRKISSNIYLQTSVSLVIIF